MRVTQGVIGLLIKTTVKEDGTAVNVSSATTKEFKLRSPSGVVKTRTASFFTNGSDGIITYETIADDLDEAGMWDIQVYLELTNGFEGHTFPDNFLVLENLE